MRWRISSTEARATAVTAGEEDVLGVCMKVDLLDACARDFGARLRRKPRQRKKFALPGLEESQ
jgi:hypothetical protein